MHGLANTLNRLANRLRPYVLFTVLNTVWRHLDKHGRSILDVGCGYGEPMQFINRRRGFVAFGADIFEPYLREARRRGNHSGFIQCDVRRLPFRSKSFDIVLCMEVLEHLEREEGRELIASLENIARRQVIITTPLGEYQQHPFDGNPHQEHRAIWSVAELKGLGFRVRGHGLPRIGGDGGLASRLPKALAPLTNILYVLAGPFVYLAPHLSGAMVGIKNLNDGVGKR